MLHSYHTQRTANRNSPSPQLTDYTAIGQAFFEWRQGIRFPVLAHFNNNAQKLHYFAARHGAGENHPTLVALKSMIERLKPDCLILEGFDNADATKQNMIELSKSISREGLAEPVYAIFLAQQNNIPFIGAEPNDETIKEALKKSNRNYTEEDLLFYNFLKQIPSRVREGIEHDSILEYLKLYWREHYTEGEEKLFNDWYMKRMHTAPTLNDLKSTEFSAPINNGHFIRQMSYDIDIIRNQNILSTIHMALTTENYSNVLVIYGCSHYFQQFNILNERYGTPSYENQPNPTQRCHIL